MGTEPHADPGDVVMASSGRETVPVLRSGEGGRPWSRPADTPAASRAPGEGHRGRGSEQHPGDTNPKAQSRLVMPGTSLEGCRRGWTRRSQRSGSGDSALTHARGDLAGAPSSCGHRGVSQRTLKGLSCLTFSEPPMIGEEEPEEPLISFSRTHSR